MPEESDATGESLSADQERPDNSHFARMLEYEERLRTRRSDAAADESFETTDPATAKTLRMLRVVFGALAERPAEAVSCDAQSVHQPRATTDAIAGARRSVSVDASVSPPNPINPSWENLEADFPRPLIDRFCLLKQLGSGNFGIVYLAADEWLSRMVAIKMLRPELLGQSQLRQRFLRESKAAAKLNHPNIVRVLETHESATCAFQVCELVEGSTLAAHLVGQPLPQNLAARIIRELADATAHAHDNHVLHRDIKPDNILTDRQIGQPLEGATVRLTDFGLARLLDEDAMQMTCSGLLVGTPHYMAPEQLTGRVKDHCPQTDVYALGIVLYELLTGANPFAKSKTVQQRVIGLAESIPSPRKLEPSVSIDLATICCKCLEVEVKNRYASARDLVDELTRFLDNRPTLARPLPLYEHLWRWSRRHQAAARGAVIAFILLLVVVSVIARNDILVRHQNVKLERYNAELTRQEREVQLAYDVANAARVAAQKGKQEYAELAWETTMREAFSAWSRRDYATARKALDGLVQSHARETKRLEWRFLDADIAQHVRCLLKLPSAIREIRAVPGRPWLLAAAADGRAYVVDIKTETLVASFETAIPSLNALAVSNDGEWFAVGGAVDANEDLAFVKVFTVADGVLRTTLPGMSTTIESLEFTDDKQWLACGARYENVRIVNLATQESFELPAARRNIWMSKATDGSRLAVQGDSPTQLWIADLASPFGGRALALGQESTCSLWLPNSQFLLAAHEDHITLYDSENGQQKRDFINARGQVECLAVDKEDKALIVGMTNGDVVKWQLADLHSTTATTKVSPDAVWHLTNGRITSIAAYEDKCYFSSDQGELLRMSKSGAGRQEIRHPNLDPTSSMATSADWNTEGDRLIIGGSNGALTQVSLATRTDLLEVEEVSPPESSPASFASASSAIDFRQQVSDIRYSPHYAGWIWTNDAGRMSLFNESARHLLLPDGIQPSQVMNRRIAISPCGKFLATALNRDVFLMDSHHLAGTPQVFRLPGSISAMEWSEDGRSILAGGDFVSVYTIDVTTGALCDSAHYDFKSDAIAARNRLGPLVSGHEDGAIRLTDSARHRLTLRLHPTEVRDIVLVDGGRLGISTDSDANIGFWLVERGQPLGLIESRVTTITEKQCLFPTLDVQRERCSLLFLRGDGIPVISLWSMKPSS